jgi:hypothetical protein
MGAFGLAIQIERQEAIDSSVGAAVEFLFGWEFQGDIFLEIFCLSQENRIFGVVVVE